MLAPFPRPDIPVEARFPAPVLPGPTPKPIQPSTAARTARKPLPELPREHPPTRREPVPDDVATAFRTQFGIAVAEVPVHRGPAVDLAARAASARAFTTRGEVFLPDAAGALTEPRGRALLAHELAHVTQQRALGADLPVEQSPAGESLEASARATEDWAGGRGAPPPELIQPNLPAAASAPPAHMQRADDNDIAALEIPVGSTKEPVRETMTPALVGEQDLTGIRDRIAELADAVGELSARHADRPDLSDPDAFTDLADRIYRNVRNGLRQELLVDRERTGLLTDLR